MKSHNDGSLYNAVAVGGVHQTLTCALSYNSK
ncbi:BnaC04g37420D [Brassica napus]|uniref:BnaC04g37420D protein n=1 Tax=Brassica napus TaxID=3708 RepID=A0A078HED5_BRANA|nr:BnaC04g37420D [Brassica napus]